MITKFNLYESINNKPRKGDYVIVTFVKKIIPTIGKIEYVNNKYSFPYLVEFDDNFNYYEYGLDENNIVVELDEIVYWSKNKEDLEPIIQGNKYNL
jgi:hypothetical protein